MPRPFVAYLRVYEPLAAFGSPLKERIDTALQAGALSSVTAVDRERELWLRSQLAAPPRLLPGERADGSPAGNVALDVLVLDPSEVPSGPAASVGPAPLVCPLDIRPRSAAGLVGFMATASAALLQAAVPVSADTVRARAAAVMTELTSGAAHVVSSTWTVPLPWFALVEPDTRQLVLAPRGDPERAVRWRVPMADARRRVARVHAVVREALGEDGPAKVLWDTGRWLQHFHPHSAVELDYGGLVQLLTDADLLGDTSAHDVQAAVDALENGDAEEVAERYSKLRDFWAELAAHERHN